MTQLYNKKILQEKRRALRHNMTKAEATLWNRLKQKQIYGQRFLRQFSIDSFIIDFYCPNIKLAIEIDGDTHLTSEEIEYDKKRQHKLELKYINFLRFTNGEVYNNLDDVLNTIISKTNELLELNNQMN